jgi:predicted nucleic acid-binding protein
MSAELWYVDSSALVKTVVAEPESGALASWLDPSARLVSCDLIRVETIRAVRMSAPTAVERARRAVAALTLIRIDRELCDLAAGLRPEWLRSLDAIHLAAALTVGPALTGIVTYDRRMTDAARVVGVRVESPGAVSEER